MKSKSIKNYKRYQLGKTDYYHRLKVLRNYDEIVRVTLNKKCNYYVSGLYALYSPNTPDLCYGSIDTRTLKDENAIGVKNNQKGLELLGLLIGRLLNKAHIMYNFSDKKIVLDLGRRKKISYKNFLKGVFTTLDQNLKEFFKIAPELRAEFQENKSGYKEPTFFEKKK